MKKLAFLFTGAAALALSACGDTADDAEDTTVVETETVEPVPVPAPTVTETSTTVVDENADDGTDVEVDVDEDGGSVTVQD